jgi:hypothetical protein
MGYFEWIKALSDLHRDAEFCLMDVTERISAGDKIIEFLITEDEGYERISRRSGRNTFRTRVYISCPGAGMNSRLEVNETTRLGLDKNIIASCGFSLHELFTGNRALFEGAYLSLKQKLGLVADSSRALLEAALGEQISKLITARLQGEDVSADIRNMLDEHVRETILMKVVPRIRTASATTHLTKLGIRQDDNFSWEYERDDNNNISFNLKLKWRSLQYGYQDHNEHVWLMHQEVQSFCIRDAFLLTVNLPTFGDQIASMLEKVGGIAT